ncbi:MAG: serine hydrolase [Vulcanimicrobiota bacterium]
MTESQQLRQAGETMHLKMTFISIFLCLFILLWSIPALGEAPSLTSLSPLEKKLKSTIKSVGDDMDVGIAVTHIEKGLSLNIHGTKAYPLASVFKVPILVTVMKKIDNGELTLATPITIREQDRCIGSGTLKELPAGTKTSVQKCIELMITISDNTATDLLWNLIGDESVNELMSLLNLKKCNIYIANRPGYMISLAMGKEFHGRTALQIAAIWKKKNMDERRNSIRTVLGEYRGLTLNKFEAIENNSAAQQTGASYTGDVVVAEALDNFCSPCDMTELLTKLYRGELLSASSTRHCLAVMGRTKYNSRIPRDLPSSARVFHKTGTICGIVNDVGIIEISKGSHVAISVLVRDIKEGRAQKASQIIAKLACTTYDYFTVNQ